MKHQKAKKLTLFKESLRHLRVIGTLPLRAARGGQVVELTVDEDTCTTAPGPPTHNPPCTALCPVA
jgi:hypothetical protein